MAKQPLKEYSFKIYDQDYVDAINKWLDNGYTTRGMLEYLLAHYMGLELPKPDEIQQINIELRELRRRVEKNESNITTIAASLMATITDMETLVSSHQPQPPTTNP